MKAILTTDGFIKIILSTDVDPPIKAKFLSKETTQVDDAESHDASKNSICLENFLQDELSVYKQTPRQVFSSTNCHVSIF